MDKIKKTILHSTEFTDRRTFIDDTPRLTDRCIANEQVGIFTNMV